MLFPSFKKVVLQEGLVHHGDGVVIGVSGGMDSMVLLHLFQRLATSFALRLTAAHVNYKLRAEDSDADETLVKTTCRSWGIDSTSISVKKRFQGNIQEKARDYRRRFMLRIAAGIGASAVALAHHEQDQAETILLHLLRGSGLAGLCGMRSLEALGAHRLIRPFLKMSRDDIERYAKKHRVPFRHDVSNDATYYRRNDIRHRLLPLLKEFNPNIVKAIAATGKRLSGDRDLFAAMAEEAYRQACLKVEETQCILDQEIFSSFPLSLRTRILQRAFEALDPDARRLNADQIARMNALAEEGSSRRATYKLPSPWIFKRSRNLLVLTSRG